jgi:hypothetical protein
VPDVEEFTVAPVRASARRARGDDYPELPWDADDLRRFAEVVSNPDGARGDGSVCKRPGEWIFIRDVVAKAGRTPYQARGDLAGLTMMVKRRFARSNWPFSLKWAAANATPSVVTAGGAAREANPTSGPADSCVLLIAR